MKVRTGRITRASNPSYQLTFAYFRTNRNQKLTAVCIQGSIPVPMIDDNTVSVAIPPSGSYNRTSIRCDDRFAVSTVARYIQSRMETTPTIFIILRDGVGHWNLPLLSPGPV